MNHETQTEAAAGDAPKKERGEIDLAGLFESEAQALLSAAERGRILHGTKNIREAGAPLEHNFRLFLQARLPAVFRVLHGYLFDASSRCTNQIDAMIIDGNDCHEMMTSPDGASYVPFVGALAIFEIKTTTYNITAALNQMDDLLSQLGEMHAAAVRVDSSVNFDKTFSVVLFAKSDGCTVKEFNEWYAKHPHRRAPSYILLLHKGFIIANRSGLLEFTSPDDPNEKLGASDHGQGGKPNLYGYRDCYAGEFSKGRALLWLYLVVMQHLEKNRNSTGTVRAFARLAEPQYGLTRIGALDSLEGWPAA